MDDFAGWSVPDHVSFLQPIKLENSFVQVMKTQQEGTSSAVPWCWWRWEFPLVVGESDEQRVPDRTRLLRRQPSATVCPVEPEQHSFIYCLIPDAAALASLAIELPC